ncbi:MAG TPA: hypothetical protein VFE45_11300, partial [Coriobacteriia bacterium]|nr:hypothetical protein [Coriobacteriia bacterium]
ATARNRPTLEAINAGLPGYAGGGAVQSAYAPWAMAGDGSSTRTPSLAGLAIEGTLDLGNGLVGVMRGVVKSELAQAQASRTLAMAGGSR